MPLITGMWSVLDEATFNALHPVSGPLHFAGSTNYIDPITRQLTGQTVRQIISSQALSFGWPLVGIYISASGQGSLPHIAINRMQFPAQTGAQREEKLQNELDAAFQFLYEETVEASRSNWVKCHIWNYRVNPNNYTPRGTGQGDFAVYISNDNPPADWWQSLD